MNPIAEPLKYLRKDIIIINQTSFIRIELVRHYYEEEKRHIICPKCRLLINKTSKFLGYLQCPFCKTLYKRKAPILTEIILEEVKGRRHK